ncbi:MAG TPA: hypothetical protein VLT33_22285, partial [Labilithrix sp.]|nr:hypothetical protein [Labilithrix sp.]
SASLFVLCALVPACTAPAPSSAEGMPPAFEATSPPAPAAAAPDAYETLKTATVFESAHVGYGGELSHNAKAFRALLAAPDPRRAMRALYTEGSLAGKLYAVAGLYLVDPESFEPAARALAKRGGDVMTRYGCMGGSSTITEILFAKGARVMIPRGKSITDYFAHSSGGMGDIAGGYVPLELATEDPTLVAPRDPLAL